MNISQLVENIIKDPNFLTWHEIFKECKENLDVISELLEEKSLNIEKSFRAEKLLNLEKTLNLEKSFNAEKLFFRERINPKHKFSVAFGVGPVHKQRNFAVFLIESKIPAKKNLKDDLTKFLRRQSHKYPVKLIAGGQTIAYKPCFFLTVKNF